MSCPLISDVEIHFAALNGFAETGAHGGAAKDVAEANKEAISKQKELVLIGAGFISLVEVRQMILLTPTNVYVNRSLSLLVVGIKHNSAIEACTCSRSCSVWSVERNGICGPAIGTNAAGISFNYLP